MPERDCCEMEVLEDRGCVGLRDDLADDLGLREFVLRCCCLGIWMKEPTSLRPTLGGITSPIGS